MWFYEIWRKTIDLPEMEFTDFDCVEEDIYVCPYLMSLLFPFSVKNTLHTKKKSFIVETFPFYYI